MRAFFATSEGGRSSRGHTCVQLFVTDKKGFVCVMPMKRKGEVLQAMKQFAKEIGAPDAIVGDASEEKFPTITLIQWQQAILPSPHCSL